ncbi:MULTISPECIES: hypothetical protein [Pseudomonas]|uniref:Uncharacterized protein n=3 Tax=Pseudomonas chlororaphis TaxID=587753 RepID=A0AAP9VWR0_9PSED|nr:MULTISPECIES: hypothetical protein [Pseudomonas]AIC17367.1 hypothetical protein EY04_00345 [Pseudomonas chlororaphis]AUG38493.1 hypothetical protein CXP47_00940 [Pseudomonas chlororaphis]AZD83055.1 hypothetical protein C4K14_0199 [Pseudomonas chlororaphis subsp. aureofaciens]AZD89646.1 hypothetical protein C4K13_0197 [Pseudomonas chlororaphis subsp. aureofaciens]AZD96096.1 hypothetical protein C4K12_0198 [Pseudomonas chlororaphis subsp. aureofaciens]
MAPRIDRIAALLNCPTKGADIRQAIKESRKDFLLEAEEEDEDPQQAQPAADQDESTQKRQTPD